MNETWKALALKPDFSEAANNYGALFLASGRFAGLGRGANGDMGAEISVPESIAFRSAYGTHGHAFFYRSRHLLERKGGGDPKLHPGYRPFEEGSPEIREHLLHR